MGKKFEEAFARRQRQTASPRGVCVAVRRLMPEDGFISGKGATTAQQCRRMERVFMIGCGYEN